MSAAKVLNTRVSSGRWLAATTRPRMTPASSPTLPPARSWSWYSKPPVLPRPMIGGRLNAKPAAPGMAASWGWTRAMIGLDAQPRVLPLLERRERHHHERAVRLGEAVQEIVADDRGHAGDAGRIAHDLLDLPHDLLGAVDRGRLGELELGEERALVLLRQEAGRRQAEQAPRGADDRHQRNEAEHRDPHQPLDHGGVAVAHVVDRAQHVAHRVRAWPRGAGFSSTAHSAGLSESAR